VHQAKQFWMTLIGGESNLASITPTAHISVPALDQHHHSLVFEGFQKVEASSNGPGTIQRL
jgi:hypothetical protein